MQAAAELWAIVRPSRTFAALAAPDEEPAPAAWLSIRRPFKWFVVIGAFVSYTTSGRLLASHLFFTLLAWGFGPLLQVIALAATRRLLRMEVPFSFAVDRFFVGQGPWFVFLVALSVTTAIVPSSWTVLSVLASTGLLALAFVVAFAWSLYLSFACFRDGFGLGSSRAYGAMLVHYGLYSASLVAYFWFSGQLPPLLGVGTP